MAGRLAGKVALVTGAARGIGAATARMMAREGAVVYVTDLDEEGARKVAGEIGGAATGFLLDVREESHWERAMERVVGERGRLDVLVNNAGITGFEPYVGVQDPEGATLESWRAVHATNLEGVFLGCKHAIRAMRPREGEAGPAGLAGLAGLAGAVGKSIVNISSRSGQVGIAGAAAYASSKAGVRNHTKTVALYCAQKGYGIRCNSVHPGAVLTPMWEPMLGAGEARERAIAEIAGGVPLGRMGTADEVAALVVFLASDESSYVTGAEFVIDGGILAGAEATPRK